LFCPADLHGKSIQNEVAMSGSLLPGKPSATVHSDATGVAATTAAGTSLGSTGLAVPPEPAASPIARLLSACRRFAWLIVLIAALGTAASIIATRFQKPVYVVTGTLWIEHGRGPRGPIQAPGLLDSFSWDELLRTYTVLDPVVEQMKLYLRPGKAATQAMFEGFELAERYAPGTYTVTVDDPGAEFSVKNASGTIVSTGRVTDSVGKELGFKWLPGPAHLKPKSKFAFSVVTPRDASMELNSQLALRTSLEGTFLTLQLTGSNPVRIAATMNALQKQFVDVAADLKKRKLRELTLLLGEQERQQEIKLREAEQALENFRIKTITLPREDGPVVPGLQMTTGSAYGKYFQERVNLESIRQDRKAIEDVLDRLQGGATTVDAFILIPAVRAAPDLSRVLTELSSADASLRALLAKYTEEYGPVKDLQASILTMRTVTVPAYARALVNQLKIEESKLESRIATSGGELKGIPMRAITEGRLQRDKHAAEVLYGNLQNRFEEAKLAEISAIPDVSILDGAKPPTRPRKDQKSRLILMGIAGSLALGVGLAFLLDRLDRRFRYPEQASHELGLSILGAIPVIPHGRNGRTVPPDKLAQVVESFRSVRLNLAHTFEAPAPICFTISSPSPGDGKSLIAANLALSFAEAGYRTLLVDGDIRRGELHRTFGTDRRPGLLDYLTSGGDVDGFLRPTTHGRLTLLPCGTRHQHGPELLGSARMAELIALLKGRFEVLLVDSPPLGAGIDPFVLGTHTGSMLLVLRSGETDRQMAEAKLRILDRLPVRMLGAILNHIDSGSGAYKYYSYSYGYASENEAGTTEEVQSLVEEVPARER
jgi:polysaccharide biosynthesis transport protein